MAVDGSETRRGFRVFGRVQGVGFRWWAQRTAEELGLGGSVRNLPDGSVEVHAVGPAENVTQLEAALYAGPTGSQVDGVEAVPADPLVVGSKFVIRH